jgi:hypothetical protein
MGTGTSKRATQYYLASGKWWWEWDHTLWVWEARRICKCCPGVEAWWTVDGQDFWEGSPPPFWADYAEDDCNLM